MDIPVTIVEIVKKDRRSVADIKELVNYLLTLDDFNEFSCRLTKSSQLELAELVKIETLPANSTLFHRGENLSTVYFVLSGRVNLYKPGKQLLGAAVKGRILWDKSIVSNETSLLTAETAEKSIFFTFPSYRLKYIMNNTVYRTFEEKLKFIEKQFPKLRNYSMAHKEKLAFSLDLHYFKKGEILIGYGEMAEHIYFIVSGECVIISQRRRKMLYLESGSSIGEECVLLNKNSKFIVKAQSDTVKTYRIRSEDYTQIIPEDVLKANRQMLKLKLTERKHLVKSSSLPNLYSTPLKQTQNGLWGFASPKAQTHIYKCFSREAKQEAPSNLCKDSLEKLRDITIRRFYKYNHPRSTVTQYLARRKALV